MEVRLAQLSSSFMSVSADYALARLEHALHDPAAPAPPIIDRLPDASEETLRSRWPKIEKQLEAAISYAKHVTATNGTPEEKGRTWLQRTVRELDRYARAIRWVLTVTEK